MERIIRDFQGVWIPKEILKLGLPEIRKWVFIQYEVDLYSENPLMEDN